MGHRANYVLIENGQVRIGFEHWGALRIPEDVLLGPEHMLAYLRRNPEGGELMDSIWCEGAVLMDVQRKVLILFGGQEPEIYWPIQEAFLRVARLQWRGWDLRWARYGVWDIAHYFDPSIDPPASDDTEGTLTCGECQASSIITVIEEDGSVFDFAGNDHRPALLLCGENLFEWLRDEHARPLAIPEPRVDLSDFGGGGWVDVPRRELHYWMADTSAGWPETLQSRWPGYTIHWASGGLCAQLAATGRDPTLGDPPGDEQTQAWLDTLLAQPRDPTNMLKEFIWQQTLEGNEVQADPRALQDRPVGIGIDARKQLHQILKERLEDERAHALTTLRKAVRTGLPWIDPISQGAVARGSFDVGSLPASSYPYRADERERFAALLSRPGWCAPATVNAQGLYEIVHERSRVPFVLVPGGAIDQGGEDGEPTAGLKGRVTVAPFLLAATACTQASWERVGGPSAGQENGPRQPVNRVAWSDVAAWCWKASAPRPFPQLARDAVLRLPSEAEWEHACRATSTGAWCFGDEEHELQNHAWFGEPTPASTHPVAQKLPNAWGLYDMHGNVWEWCADHAASPPDGSQRVALGGGVASPASDCRASSRSLFPGDEWDQLGFRPAASLPVVGS